MSLEAVLLEVFKLIVDPLETKDYLSLCLTSKRLLHLTRPFLYKSISLNLSEEYWYDLTSDFKEVKSRDKTARDCFFRTFSQLPELASFITSLELRADPSLFNRFSLLPSMVSFLQNAKNLQHLSLSRHQTGRGYFSSTLLDAIPSSLTSLKIGYQPMEEEEVTRLFGRPIALTNLDISEMRPERFVSLDAKLPRSLIKLKLPALDRLWCPFHETVVNNLTRLEDFNGCFYATRSLVALDFSKLTSLVLVSPFDHGSFGRPSSMAQVTSELKPLLNKAPNLLNLVVNFGYFCGGFDHSRPSPSIIHHLPLKLKRLSLAGSYFFEDRDFLRYLSSSARSSRLSRLALPLRWHEVAREDVKELCSIRGIQLEYIDWNTPEDHGRQRR
ncbi:hypothetical protein JCM3765_006400 [Sporobolomyces pararoseus]